MNTENRKMNYRKNKKFKNGNADDLTDKSGT
jgi:hypothetical protein